MQLRVGFEMIHDCPQPTPVIFTLNVHASRVADLIGRDQLSFDPPVPTSAYRDSFGNWCTRAVLPAGRTRVWSDVQLHDSGAPDLQSRWAVQHAVQDLPEDSLQFLLGSRYCETDRLSSIAWNLFGHGPTGWDRVQAICDYKDQPRADRARSRCVGRRPQQRIRSDSAGRLPGLERRDRGARTAAIELNRIGHGCGTASMPSRHRCARSH